MDQHSDASHGSRISVASSPASTRKLMDPHAHVLEPPTAPFHSRSGSAASLTRESGTSTPTSLSVNYLPSKFAPVGGARRRAGKGGAAEDAPKRGGGREAFRAGENRMPDATDEDYDGVQGAWFGKTGGHTKPRMKWTRFKWILFVANLLFSIYSLAGLIFCITIWFNAFTHADVLLVGNRTELVLSTIACALGVTTSIIGWAGILLNNRAFLAVYTFLLWICFAFLVAPGYITYKKRTFNLEGKINAQWSRDLGTEGRLRVQNELHCCGYYSPYVEASISQTCYARTTLPGCKNDYLKYERRMLGRWYTIVFSIVPAHVAVMVAGLLCSNHITYRFGKGMMPKAYRLSLNSMAVIMDNYANQLAEQYGTDVASEIINSSRSNLELNQMPQVVYGSGRR